MATYDLRESVNVSAMAVEPQVDEFELAGVEKEDCIDAPGPRVKQSPIQFECRYISTTRFPGRSAVGTVDVVFGEVARIHIDEKALTPDILVRSEHHHWRIESKVLPLTERSEVADPLGADG